MKILSLGAKMYRFVLLGTVLLWQKPVTKTLSIVTVLVFATLGSLWVYGYSVRQHQCLQSVDDIQKYTAFSKEACSFTLAEVVTAKNREGFYHPKLASVVSQVDVFKAQQNEYDQSRLAYQNLYTIAQKLGISNLNSPENLDAELLSQYSTIPSRTQAMETKIEDLRKQVALYIDYVDSFTQKIRQLLREATNLGVSSGSILQYQQLVTKKYPTTPEEAELIKALVLNPLAFEQEIENQIKAQNPNYPSVVNVTLPILMYHRIEDYSKVPKRQRSNIRQQLTISPQVFSQQLDFLQSKGYQTVTMGDIEEAVLTKNLEFFSQKLVMLTFDDGYIEHYSIAYPELKKRQMKGVFGIVTNYRGMTWDQLKEMSDNGMEIVGHTVSHCPLAGITSINTGINGSEGQYQACSDRSYGQANNLMPYPEVKFEVQESKKVLEEKLGKPVRFMIYPYGSYNAQTKGALEQSGYTLALKVGGGPSIHLQNPLALNRVNVSGLDQPLGGWFSTVE